MKRKKLSIKYIIFIVIAVSIFTFITNKITPTIYKKCKFEIEKFAINEINKAITQAIDQYGYNYEDYITIKTSDEGNVIAIYTNARQISTIHNAIIDKINKELNDIKYQHIDIALGSLTGVIWLSSRGPHIPIKIAYKGLTNSEIISSLEESGINQTLHKIHIVVTANMVGFLPFHTENVEVKSDYMLAESFIVGQIPKHYTKVVSKDVNNLESSYKYT